MSNELKVYAMNVNADNGADAQTIYDAILKAAGALYVDVSGLGLVEITTSAAFAAVTKMHKENGAERFALCKPSSKHGLGEKARILMNWY